MNPFNNFVRKYKVKHHKENKRQLLRLIDLMKKTHPEAVVNRAYARDFHIKKKRTYHDVVVSMVDEYIEDYARSFGCKHDKSYLPWFQQYQQKVRFDWHAHNHVVAFVYYLELPNSECATKFFNYPDIEVEEGDLIMFPCFMAHHSNTQDEVQRKTVIAANINMDIDNEYLRNIDASKLHDG